MVDGNKIKYSLLMPFYKRYSQFEKTLSSLVFWYEERKDIEVIIVFDSKVTRQEARQVELLIMKTPEINVNTIYRKSFGCNPCVSFNIGAQTANGEFLVITNPECYHIDNILGGFDEEFAKNKDVYVVCACKALTKEYTMKTWYQHSVFKNKEYHFCSALHKDNYWKIGGFDERFANGISYDDDAFREAIKKAKIPFVHRDDLVVNHLYHRKLRPPNAKSMLKLNEEIYKTYYLES
jgi:hypothetical protein